MRALDAASHTKTGASEITLGTVPGTVPRVVQDATARATSEPICAATFSLNCTAVPTVIPAFDCRAMHTVIGRLIRQVSRTPTLELNLAATVTVNREAVFELVVRPTPMVSLAQTPRRKTDGSGKTPLPHPVSWSQATWPSVSCMAGASR